MTPAIAPYVSAISVMLAAYGFFYNAYKDRVQAGLDVGSAAPGHTAWEKQVAAVEQARAAARLLTIVPLVVFALLAPKLAAKVDDAFAVDFSLHRYSTLDVLFVVLACTWLVIAYALSRQFAALGAKKKELERARPQPQ